MVICAINEIRGEQIYRMASAHICKKKNQRNPRELKLLTKNHLQIPNTLLRNPLALPKDFKMANFRPLKNPPMKKTLFLTIAVSIIGCSSLVAQSTNAYRDWEHQINIQLSEELQDALNLKRKQVEQLADLRDETLEKLRPLQKQYTYFDVKITPYKTVRTSRRVRNAATGKYERKKGKKVRLRKLPDTDVLSEDQLALINSFDSACVEMKPIYENLRNEVNNKIDAIRQVEETHFRSILTKRQYRKYAVFMLEYQRKF